eukprot:23595-Pyramimonas_sp.AAC.1
MEGASFPKCGSLSCAAHIRSESLQRIHGWKAGGVQIVDLLFAPRTFVLKGRDNFTDGRRI